MTVNFISAQFLMMVYNIPQYQSLDAPTLINIVPIDCTVSNYEHPYEKLIYKLVMAEVCK